MDSNFADETNWKMKLHADAKARFRPSVAYVEARCLCDLVLHVQKALRDGWTLGPLAVHPDTAGGYSDGPYYVQALLWERVGEYPTMPLDAKNPPEISDTLLSVWWPGFREPQPKVEDYTKPTIRFDKDTVAAIAKQRQQFIDHYKKYWSKYDGGLTRSNFIKGVMDAMVEKSTKNGDIVNFDEMDKIIATAVIWVNGIMPMASEDDFKES